MPPCPLQAGREIVIPDMRRDVIAFRFRCWCRFHCGLWLRHDLLTGLAPTLFPFPLGANGIAFYLGYLIWRAPDIVTDLRRLRSRRQEA